MSKGLNKKANKKKSATFRVPDLILLYSNYIFTGKIVN